MKDIELHSPETKELSKAFGIFVGLYNKINNTNFSVKAASTEPSLILAFDYSQKMLTKTHNYLSDNNPNYSNVRSTKIKSYTLLDIPKNDRKIYNYIKENSNQSRVDIAYGLGIRVSTVCGAVNRLLHNALVHVTGIKIDPETNKKAETISSIGC